MLGIGSRTAVAGNKHLAASGQGGCIRSAAASTAGRRVCNVLKSSRWAERDMSKSEFVMAGLAARFAPVMFLAEGYGENVPQD